MAWIHGLLLQIDGVLIAPYRWVPDPVAGWFIGTLVLAAWAVLLGELSLALAYRGNRVRVTELLERTRYYHEQSLKARGAGAQRSYRGINRLANEAYGKSFFLLLAMGMGSLWPVFLAMAWMEQRFADLSFRLPDWIGGLEVGFVVPFLGLYVLARVAFSRLKSLAPALLHASLLRSRISSRSTPRESVRLRSR
jgi:hypothetical protein